MPIDRESSSGARISHRRVIVAAAWSICGLSLSTCAEAPPEGVPIEALVEAPVHEVRVEPVVPAPAPAPPPPVAVRPPAPPPPPAPDPEALAQAREDAARLRFEREYPWHGIAYHFLAQVYQRADSRSPVIGYMRRGTQLRAQAGVRGPGCVRGWHRVPGAGFVCRGAGFALGDTPQSFEPSPVAPALDDALPYAYAWVTRDDVPQYWRLPTVAEESAALEWIRAQRRPTPRPVAPSRPATGDESTEPRADEPEPDLEAPPGLVGDASEVNAEAPDAGLPRSVDGGTAEQPTVLRMIMRRGFYVSIDRLEVSEGRRFYRTVRGAYVPADPFAEASPPSMRGVVLGGRWSLPMGFVYRGGVRSLTRDSARGVLGLAAPVERSTPLPLSDEVIVRQGQRYRVSNRGHIVREDALRVARLRARPPGVSARARWIHVDLDEQVLVAYEGDVPMFATMVSTGRAGFATPTGTFRIQSKHVSTTMDDPNGGDEAYSIEDVPWTMYFEGSYALHGAFWHDRFGRPRSHGCVNLAPADARWIFQWTEPNVPAGWHGLSATRAQGTLVHITSSR